MKTLLSLLAGAALIGAAVSFSTPSVQAQQAVAPAEVKPPFGQLCIVTLDPRAERAVKPAGDALKKTSLTGDDTVEGTLVLLDNEWLVLKDGTYENWIPRDKVLFMRASR
jgi:hypothetical protein